MPVVGVDHVGSENHTEKTKGGRIDADATTITLLRTGKTGLPGCTSGFCGSTLNLKSGMAMTDAVKVAKEAK